MSFLRMEGGAEGRDEGVTQNVAPVSLSVLRGFAQGGAAPDLLDRLLVVARQMPDAPAVEASDGAFTYRQLVDQVARVARLLDEHGVKPGDLVGVSLPRGSRELVAMLATLGVGAAYVPLDLSLPVERRALILEDARPSLWIRDGGAPSLEAPKPDEPRSWFFPPWTELPQATTDVTWRRAEEIPDQLAYVLFTSGSTGRPKGVEVRRSSFQAFLRAMAREPGFSRGQRILAVSTTSFDISGLELFLPLWVGGTTVIADRTTVRDPSAWARALDERRIDCLQATPSGWRLLLDAGWTGKPGLKMLCGGEPLTEPLAERLLSKGGELWNVYGPTETTVWSTLSQVTDPRDLTVGHPIDDTLIAVIDEAGQPCAPGVEGEIVIGGMGLARGYRQRPDLTAAAFVEATWLSPPQRIYKTGDRGRLTTDGRLVCLGRRDGQVKILGHRIELGEVERALRRTSGVNEVVVLAENVGERNARLAAFWQGSASSEELETAARAVLPPYMVPSRYVQVAVFPLNPNGKIDRKVLATLEDSTSSTASTGVAESGGDWETLIATCWGEVLGRPRVALDDDVFRLGATSLLVADLHLRIQSALGRPFPLAAVFEARTPRELAQKIHEVVTGDESIVVRVKRAAPGKKETPLFCVMGVALYRHLALALTTDRDVWAMDVRPPRRPGQQDPGLEGIIAATASAYVQAIRKVEPRGPYALIGLCYGGIVAFEAARQLVAAGATVESVTILDAILPEGVTIDQRARVASHLARARREPRAWARDLWQTLSIQLKAHPLWNRAQGLPAKTEIPVDGPEADRAIAAFANNRHALAIPTLVVQATQAPIAPWMSVRSDLGWQALAPQHRVLAIDTGHLELLEPPHVARLAGALEAQFAKAKGPAHLIAS